MTVATIVLARGAEPGGLSRSLLRIIIPPVGIILVLSSLLFLQIQHLLEQTREVGRTGEILARGNDLYRKMGDQETGLRGYLLTRDVAFLEPYRAGQAQVGPELADLEALVAGDAGPRSQLRRVRAEHTAWEREAEAAIQARSAGSVAPALTPMLLIRTQQMDRLRSSLEGFVRDEEELQSAHIAEARRQTRVSLGSGMSLFLVVVGGVTVISRRRLREVSSSYHRATEAEAHLRRLWDSSIIGIMIADVGGEITGANDSVLEMIEYTREDVDAGRVRWADMTPPEYLHIDAARIAESLRLGACVPYEKVYIAKGGRRVPILIGYALLEGSRTRYISFVLDLTERKRAEQELAEQHALTRTITDNADAALFMEDLDGRCIFLNPAAEVMTGFSLDEIAQRPLHDVIHAQRADGSPLSLEDCPIHRAPLAQGGLRGHEDVFTRKSGERFPVVCSASPVTRDGRQIATVLEARDITDQKRIETERERLLESEHAARSAAEREARIKDEFLAMLSHELRTPLTAVLGWTYMLRKGALDAKAIARALDVIERNTLAEVQLVDDLLDMSRVSSGKLRLDVRSVELADLLEAATASVRPAIDARRLRLEMILDRGVGPVMADRGRLEQVVSNLLSNAIKFTPEGGRVTVVLHRAGSNAEIVVRDSGEGIRAGFLPHVFERFRQADSSTTRSHAGLGLGLSLVRNLVELHGGSVFAESEGEGRGAAFTVSLPIAALRRDAEIADDTGLDPCESLRGIRVLVVDDEEDTRELVGRLLTDCHAEVVAVGSAAEALDEVRRFRPDVLLSDIGMPHQDGYQLLRTLRGLGGEHGGNTPAAALTAFARPEDRVRALRAGYQIHVSKPVRASELITIVARLSRKRATKAGDGPS